MDDDDEIDEMNETVPLSEGEEGEEEEEEEEEEEIEKKGKPQKAGDIGVKILKKKIITAPSPSGGKGIKRTIEKEDEGTVVVRKKGRPLVTLEVSPNAKVMDLSGPRKEYKKDRLLIGDRYSIQMGIVSVGGRVPYTYEALCIKREGSKTNPEAKEYSFNLPSKLVEPLLDALNILVGVTTLEVK